MFGNQYNSPVFQNGMSAMQPNPQLNPQMPNPRMHTTAMPPSSLPAHLMTPAMRRAQELHKHFEHQQAQQQARQQQQWVAQQQSMVDQMNNPASMPQPTTAFINPHLSKHDGFGSEQGAYSIRRKNHPGPRSSGAVSQHHMLHTDDSDALSVCIAVIKPYSISRKCEALPPSFDVTGGPVIEEITDEMGFGNADGGDEWALALHEEKDDSQSGGHSKKRSRDLPIKTINFYEHIPASIRPMQFRNPNYPIAPKHPFRVCILGVTGAGKTNILLNLIKTCACFDFVHGLAETPDEPLYKLLHHEFGNRCFISNVWEECMPDLNKIPSDANVQRICFFDDQVAADPKQMTRMKKFIQICRKKNVSLAILKQAFRTGPQDKFLRDNCNELFIKSVNDVSDLHKLLKDKNVAGVDKELLEDMYHEAVDNGEFLNISQPGSCEHNQEVRIGFNLNKRDLRPPKEGRSSKRQKTASAPKQRDFHEAVREPPRRGRPPGSAASRVRVEEYVPDAQEQGGYGMNDAFESELSHAMGRQQRSQQNQLMITY